MKLKWNKNFKFTNTQQKKFQNKFGTFILESRYLLCL